MEVNLVGLIELILDWLHIGLLLSGDDLWVE